MDLETENRLAALLMEEARRLRVQADKEGVHAYLCKPNVRARPNSRFLTATVLGVEQANRAVEVGELWRAREKELELDTKLKNRVKDKYVHNRDKRQRDDPHHHRSSSRHGKEQAVRSTSCSSSKYDHDEDNYQSGEDDGLRDDELEQFLRSRAKRGRGDIGPRMDEPGPYPSTAPTNPDTRFKEEWESRILGPDKPSFIKPTREESEDERSSKKKHKSKRDKLPEKSKCDKKERKSKHRRHKSRRSRETDSDSE